jgi:hypothetical protein
MARGVPRRLTLLVGSCALALGCGRVNFEPGDSAPSGDAPPPGSRAVDAFLESFSTTTTSFVDVPIELVFTPADSAEAWVFLLSGEFSGGTDLSPAPEARYLVNGVERGFGGGAGEPGTSSPWQHVDLITTAQGPQTVTVQLRRTEASAESAVLGNLRLLAFPLPPDADPHFSEVPPPAVVSPMGNWAPFHTLDVTPREPGDYLVLALAVITEEPSPGVAYMRIRDADGAFWPAREFANDRRPWHSFLAARRQRLAASPSTFTIELRAPTATPATARDLRFLAFRVDALASFASTSELEPVTIATSQPVVTSVVTTEATPVERTYVVYQGVQVYEDGGGVVARGLHFRAASSPPIEYLYRTNNFEQSLSFGVVRLVRAGAATTFENAISSPDLATLTAAESVIHVLGLGP